MTAGNALLAVGSERDAVLQDWTDLQICPPTPQHEGAPPSRRRPASPATNMPTPSEEIDKQIARPPRLARPTMAELRKLINEADPNLKEDWKWGTPVWTKKGNVISLGAFKEHVKVNFFKGASLDDPKGIFNAGLDAKATRSIDLRENNPIDEQALKDLIRAAVNQDAGR